VAAISSEWWGDGVCGRSPQRGLGAEPLVRGSGSTKMLGERVLPSPYNRRPWFCQFIVDKVRRIRDNILAALQSSVPRTFAVRQHLGPELSSFEPVTAEEVRKLSKSSPLDVLPCSLLKSCVHVFTPAIARLANQSLQTGKFPVRYKRA